MQQRHDEFVHEAVKYFDRRVVTFPQDRLANSYARRLEAQIALRDGEYEQALERLNESRLGFQWLWSGRPYLSQVPENAMRVEALYALGRTDEALTWLEAIGDGLSNTMASLGFLYQDIAPAYFLQGKIHEEKRNIEKAIHFYTRFIKTLETADPEIQPTVEDARERLDRLVLLQAREPG